jgi:ATP-dependent DNA helicase DinG
LHPREETSNVIEVEVHQQLRAFLREQGEPYWHHHLTMARLVARALRLDRHALIQTGATSGYNGHYRLSYLMPALLWHKAVVLVVPEELQHRLLMVEIPRLRQWIPPHKSIRTGDRFPCPEFQGLLITSPQAWLSDRLFNHARFPTGIPTLIDGADDIETWMQEQLTICLQPRDWEELMLACPTQTDAIRDARIQLTRLIYQHPINPYDRYLLEAPETSVLTDLYQTVWHSCMTCASENPLLSRIPQHWLEFWQSLQQGDRLIWTSVMRQQGQFSLHSSPVEVRSSLETVWAQQPVVLIGTALDLESDAPIYRQRVGLAEATCLRFSGDRQHELIQLYLPDRLPMPNTPQFQTALLQELRTLLSATTGHELTVILIGDVPLKAQAGSILAAEFGSRVQVEKTCLDDQGILVAGWEFWREHQRVLPAPQLLVIATLPIPSLEDPLVAGRVAHYKQQRQDWFRLYLLPEALSELQRAIAPVRESRGVVALLDNRVNHRSYGQHVLTALSPMARINYIDRSLFNHLDFSVLE